MPFFHQKSLKCPQIIEALKERKDVAEMIKCTIFDWGDRCKNINGHLHEFKEYL